MRICAWSMLRVMLTIACLLLKGGVAKTTTAAALAEAASEIDPTTTAYDTDPMGGLQRWRALAEAAGKPFAFNVIGYASPDINKRYGSLSQGVGVGILDAPPPGALAVAKAVADLADIIVMPCPAKLAELDRVSGTLENIPHGKKVYAAITLVSNEMDRQLSRETLERMGVTVLDTELRTSTKVSRNYGLAPRGPLLSYGRDLLAEITKRATS